MSEEFIHIDDDLRFDPIGQYFPLELTPDNRSALGRISEEFHFALPSISTKPSNMVIEEARYTYPTQLTNSFDRENWTVSTDHCYARPWNWRPEATFLRPTKTLFVPKLVPIKPTSNPLVPIQDTEDVIDIESEVEVPAPSYDVVKARVLMEECEKFALSVRADTEEDWEEKVSKIGWTTSQHKVFNTMVSILNNFHLSKLTYSLSPNEPLLRRTVIDKAVQRVRRLLASVLWEPKISQWIHQVLIDNLGPHYLACYLDILQTLKSKLPTFLDKMMHSMNSSSRTGSLNYGNLQHLLERPWDPVSNTLMLDKPKKLPGNPVIVVVPSGPIMSKMVQKWIKLLSNLATVFTIPTNFGSTGHRMTMPSILDQLFSVTRGKIQEVKEDYPGRNIILIGFNSGASLALQVAQAEPVLCVISVGFSLLTAEGPRGEPDDNILELQCPVLFVIGQCSNTSNQEDLEDMRERMRVETGLLVVGSADDFLRVNKKKKRQEGITQSIVDRCIVDEIGEFISGLILSPYPPQIRQSPAHVPPETPVKKGNTERKRYNSNTSSVDSEPPSPTPLRIPRPVGRPPGSKSKNRLEAKWAQQIAQGNTNSIPTTASPTSPPAYSNLPTPDTSSNESSSVAEKPLLSEHQVNPVKKIKTLKPVVSADTKAAATLSTTGTGKAVLSTAGVPQQTARMHAFGMNRNLVQGNTSVTNLLQGGIKTISPTVTKSSASSIKVLENLSLNSSTTGKFLPNRSIDLSKITLLNSTKTPNNTGINNNVLLLPDTKLKTVSANTKTGGAPILLPISPQKSISKLTIPSTPKYITGKRQLINQRPPRPIKKPLFMPTSSLEAPLPPPTNLTTQDIMDLPIIFADDNQILNTPGGSSDNSTSLPMPSKVATSTPVQIHQVPKTVGPAKYMLVNKQSLGQGNFILTPNIKKSETSFNKPAPKYTKIILSSKKNTMEELKPSRIQCISSDLNIKKVLNPQGQKISSDPSTPSSSDLMDLENEIEASTVPKPNLSTASFKNIKIIPRSSPEVLLVQKRPSTEVIDECDPDYVPPKNLKFE